MTLSTRSRPLVLAAAGALLLSACGGSDDTASAEADAGGATDYPVTVADCAGDRTFDAKPARVLTVGSAAISLLDAAGAAGAVTARSGEFGASLPSDLDDPPTKAEVVDPSDPSAEAIIGASPDVVYGYGLFNAKPETLEQAGIPTLTVAGECGHDATAGESAQITFGTVTDDIRRLGRVFDTADVADERADALDARVERLSASVQDTGDTAAWLYYFSSTDPLSAYGSTSMADAVLDGAKLENVFGSEKTSYLEVSGESLAKQDPDWIVLSYGLYGESAADARRQLLSEPSTKDLAAVKAGRVILVPGTGSEPSPQSVEGLDAVVTALADGR